MTLATYESPTVGNLTVRRRTGYLPTVILERSTFLATRSRPAVHIVRTLVREDTICQNL